MPLDLPGQRHLFPDNTAIDPTTLLDHLERKPNMSQTIPAEAREKLRNAAASIESQLNRPADELTNVGTTIQQILADLLEQIGPYLIQLLISLLMQQPPKR